MPAPVLGSIVGQELAVAVLDHALAHEASHAYLFTGPRGTGKSDAALAFAAGLVCPSRGCGECDTCGRVHRGIHPDVEVVSPDGVSILVGQVREINREVALRPFEAAARCYVILEAETMNEEAANAFLKTLEEPPSHVHFVLVTNAYEKVRPTIASRCQLVHFTRVPAVVLTDYLVRVLGVREGQAGVFARVSQGSLAYARLLATSPEARVRRERFLGWARSIPASSMAELEHMLDEIMDSSEEEAVRVATGLETLRERDLEWAPDARARSRVQKAYDQRVKRERRRVAGDTLAEVRNVFAYWYRDMAAVAMGADDAVCNYDYLFELQREGTDSQVPAYLDAVRVAQRADHLFRYNVDARCALEDMLLSLKEALR
jgi:DNA polymerase-3 subunit delta'